MFTWFPDNAAPESTSLTTLEATIDSTNPDTQIDFPLIGYLDLGSTTTWDPTASSVSFQLVVPDSLGNLPCATGYTTTLGTAYGDTFANIFSSINQFMPTSYPGDVSDNVWELANPTFPIGLLVDATVLMAANNVNSWPVQLTNTFDGTSVWFSLYFNQANSPIPAEVLVPGAPYLTSIVTGDPVAIGTLVVTPPPPLSVCQCLCKPTIVSSCNYSGTPGANLLSMVARFQFACAGNPIQGPDIPTRKCSIQPVFTITDPKGVVVGTNDPINSNNPGYTSSPPNPNFQTPMPVNSLWCQTVTPTLPPAYTTINMNFTFSNFAVEKIYTLSLSLTGCATCSPNAVIQFWIDPTTNNFECVAGCGSWPSPH